MIFIYDVYDGSFLLSILVWFGDSVLLEGNFGIFVVSQLIILLEILVKMFKF